MEVYEHLFEPIKINEVELKNRIIFGPHVPGFQDEAYLPGEKYAYYLRERAKGGVGLIINPSLMAHPSASTRYHSQAFLDDAVVGLKMIAEMVHEEGAKIFAQIAHPGPELGYDNYHAGLAPSEYIDPFTGMITQAIEKEQIIEVEEAFADAVKKVQDAGFDGVEFKAGHDGIMRQFWSPKTNKRDDEYGGDLENRMRFSLEVVDKSRDKVGDNFPIGVRGNIEEFYAEEGIDPEMWTEIAKKLVDRGEIDYINNDTATYVNMDLTIPTMRIEPGYNLYGIAAVKEAVDVPVVAACRINTPEQANNIIAEGQADLTALVRPLIADPFWPIKSEEGRDDEIRLCVNDNVGCFTKIFTVWHIGCIQNPCVGREKTMGEGTLEPASEEKKVVVVGGGPAGMKAAEISAKRGHDVVLFEKEELGGRIMLESKVPYRENMEDVARYLKTMLEKHGVDVRANTEATVDIILDENPDRVIVATGAVFPKPEIPGYDEFNTATIDEVIKEEADLKGKIALFDNLGNEWALWTAEGLVEAGHDIVYITPTLYPGGNIPAGTGRLFPSYANIAEQDAEVDYYPSYLLTEIMDGKVKIQYAFGPGEETIDKIDTTIVAPKPKANDALYFDLKGEVEDLERVGDCVAPRDIESVIWDGEVAGREWDDKEAFRKGFHEATWT